MRDWPGTPAELRSTGGALRAAYRIAETVDGVPVDTGGFSWEGRTMRLPLATAAARKLYSDVLAALRPRL